jgi:hypothetical protein
MGTHLNLLPLCKSTNIVVARPGPPPPRSPSINSPAMYPPMPQMVGSSNAALSPRSSCLRAFTTRRPPTTRTSPTTRLTTARTLPTVWCPRCSRLLRTPLTIYSNSAVTMLAILSGSRQLPWGGVILLKADEVNIVVLMDSCPSILDEELAAAVSPFLFPFLSFARACFPFYELPFL